MISRTLGQKPKSRSKIDAVALKNETRLAGALYEILLAAQQAVPLKALADLLQVRDVDGIEHLLDVDRRMLDMAQGKGIPHSENSLTDVLQSIMGQGAQIGLQELDRVPVRKSVASEMKFDLMNPAAVTFLERYRFNLITNISRASRESIRGTLIDAFEQGGDIASQAREIRQVIGLTTQQAQAVRNFRAALNSGDPAQMNVILDRVLRDRRYDSTILRAIGDAKKLPKAYIDKVVDRYAERTLNYRATSIARTESLRASRMGQQEAWRQAEEQGLLDQSARQRWSLAPNACDRCQDVADENEDGVPLGDDFDTDEGPLDGPPLHTHCRCTVVLEFA